MKYVTIAARLLLGVIFTVFGLNGFFHFIPQPPMPPGIALDYFKVMIGSHYLVLPFALQAVTDVLFLLNKYVPLALALIAPVIVNILLFHILMEPAGLPPGTVAAVCWLIVAYDVRSAFNGLLEARDTGFAR